jgi:hypothetical protein
MLSTFRFRAPVHRPAAGIPIVRIRRRSTRVLGNNDPDPSGPPIQGASQMPLPVVARRDDFGLSAADYPRIADLGVQIHVDLVQENHPVFGAVVARRELKRLMTWTGWSAVAAEFVPQLASLPQRFFRRLPKSGRFGGLTCVTPWSTT